MGQNGQTQPCALVSREYYACVFLLWFDVLVYVSLYEGVSVEKYTFMTMFVGHHSYNHIWYEKKLRGSLWNFDLGAWLSVCFSVSVCVSLCLNLSLSVSWSVCICLVGKRGTGWIRIDKMSWSYVILGKIDRFFPSHLNSTHCVCVCVPVCFSMCV